MFLYICFEMNKNRTYNQVICLATSPVVNDGSFDYGQRII